MINAKSGMFLPTTYTFDVDRIQEVNVNSQEFKELLVRLYQNISNICTAVNLKEVGYYPIGQITTGKQLFPNPVYNSSTTNAAVYRPIIRYTMNFGALPNTAAKSVVHGITMTTSFIGFHIYATATDTTGLTQIPVPNSWILIDATNITITTPANLSNYNECVVVWEYITY